MYKHNYMKVWLFALSRRGNEEMDDFKEEKNYLDQVILNIEDKIKNTNLTTERLRKEVENIGVPNWDERKYFQNCKNKKPIDF